MLGVALRCHGEGSAGQTGQGALEGPSLLSTAGEPVRGVGGLAEPLVLSRPSPSLREALSPLCWGCRVSDGSAPGGHTSCAHTQSADAGPASEMPSPLPPRASGGQTKDGLRGFWLRALGLTSQEGTGLGGCCHFHEGRKAHPSLQPGLSFQAGHRA